MGAFRVVCAVLLVVFNVLLWGVAAGLLFIASEFFIQSHQYAQFLNTQNAIYTLVPVIVIGICGLLLGVLGFVGIIGAICANQSLLLTYNILLSVVLIVQVTGGILAVVFREDIYNEMSNALLTNMAQYQYGAETQVNEGIDQIQDTLKCCGAAGPDDWKEFSWINGAYDNAIAPASCCNYNTTSADFCTIYDIELHEDGCVAKFFSIVSMWGSIVISISVLLALFEVTGIILSYLVMCLKSRDSQDVYVQV